MLNCNNSKTSSYQQHEQINHFCVPPCLVWFFCMQPLGKKMDNIGFIFFIFILFFYCLNFSMNFNSSNLNVYVLYYTFLNGLYLTSIKNKLMNFCFIGMDFIFTARLSSLTDHHFWEILSCRLFNSPLVSTHLITLQTTREGHGPRRWCWCPPLLGVTLWWCPQNIHDWVWRA